jgi:hypothetical protein
MNKKGLEFWRSNIVLPYYNVGPIHKQSRIRTHTVITTLIAVGLCLQFVKKIRDKRLDIHRNIGKATLVLTLMCFPHFVMLIGGFFHQTAKYAEAPILFMIPYFAIRGWIQVSSADMFLLLLVESNNPKYYTFQRFVTKK